MTKSWILAPEPIWTLINNDGTLAGGGYIKTKSSLTFADKPVYIDAGGTQPYPNPIIFNLNGTNGPFYFEVDDAAPNDNYFLQAFNSDDNILWTVNNFAPPSGGGGGSNITTVISLENYISNGVFIDHCDNTSPPATITNLVIAPSNHKGFTPADLNPVVGTYGVVGPDIRFVRNSTASLDEITFENFNLADDPFSGSNDVTPVQYLRYQSTNTSAGELYKAFQFPICQKVKNLANQTMTFQCWAKATTNVNLELWTRQYYGNGASATAESGTTRVSAGTLPLTNVWTRFTVQFVMPNVGGNTIGAIGSQTDDDAVYLQLEMPLNVNCDVSFTKPALHLGSIQPDQDFNSYDQIYSTAQNVRTGDLCTSLRSTQQRGWLLMNDKTIGNVSSGATNRAAADTFQLYKTLWDGVPALPLVPPGRGASAIADFLANKALTLPSSLGRALANAGAGSGLTARTLGQSLGTETISIADMPAHNHPGSTVPFSNQAASRGGGGADTVTNLAPGSVTVASQGGSGADGKMQPTSFVNVFIKL